MAIRVLVVDDSAIVRKMISNVLESDPDLEVVCTAASGELALEKVKQFNPDVITLDIEMPGLGGLETLKLLHADNPSVNVLMVSGLTEAGARVTLDALALGALDYITKPSSSSGGLSNEEFSRMLKEKVKAIKPAEKKPVRSVVGTINQSSKESKFTDDIDLTLIGVSTGGPKALASVLPRLAENYPTPILIVQHMPPMFTKLLAERLNEQCKISVVEAEEGMPAMKGVAYIAPGGFHMEVHSQGSEKILKLTQNDPENSCRPAVDVLFRSAVQVSRGQIFAIMMTGMGQDGLKGCRSIKQAGGLIYCQDQASSVVWGMPGYVVGEGLADGVFPLEDLASEINEVAFRRLSNGKSAQ